MAGKRRSRFSKTMPSWLKRRRLPFSMRLKRGREIHVAAVNDAAFLVPDSHVADDERIVAIGTIIGSARRLALRPRLFHIRWWDGLGAFRLIFYIGLSVDGRTLGCGPGTGRVARRLGIASILDRRLAIAGRRRSSWERILRCSVARGRKLEPGYEQENRHVERDRGPARELGLDRRAGVDSGKPMLTPGGRGAIRCCDSVYAGGIKNHILNRCRTTSQSEFARDCAVGSCRCPFLRPRSILQSPGQG